MEAGYEDRLLIENLDFGKLHHSIPYHSTPTYKQQYQKCPLQISDVKNCQQGSCSDLIVLLISNKRGAKNKHSARFQTSPSIRDYNNRTPTANVTIKFSVIPVITVRRYYISTHRKYTSTHPNSNSSFQQYEKYTNKKYKYSQTPGR